MNFAAVVYRSQDTFCYPIDEDRCLVTLRTGKEMTDVILNWEDPMESEFGNPQWIWKGRDAQAQEVIECDHYILWKFVIKPPFKRLGFIFKLYQKEEEYFLLENGFFKKDDPIFKSGRFQYFSYPWMNPSDLIKTPSWVADTMWYQIFPERFCKGNDALPKGVLLPWQSGPVTNEEFYGGDLRGIISRLEYIHDLGLNGIYMTPIFEAGTSHKYDTKDYRKIDPAFGTYDDLKELVDQAHALGMRVMLDGVFNHCGDQFGPWLDVVEKGPESEYFNWFMVHKWPFDFSEGFNTYDGKYASFSFVPQMPKLNTNYPPAAQYLIDSCVYWAELGIDGIRLDVAHEVSHHFLKKLRERLKDINPEFYILGEIWQDSIKWLRGDELDSVMNYPFRFAAMRFLNDSSMTGKDFARTLTECTQRYPVQVNRCLFNLLDSHDTKRLMSACRGNKDAFFQMLLLLYTMEGTTCSFYGTELMLEGGEDPDCRRCMPWERIEQGDYDAPIEEFKKIVALRRSEPLTRSDGLVFPDEKAADGRVLVYRRFNRYFRTEQKDFIEVWINASEANVEAGQGEILLSRKAEGSMVLPGGYLVLKRL